MVTLRRNVQLPWWLESSFSCNVLHMISNKWHFLLAHLHVISLLKRFVHKKVIYKLFLPLFKCKMLFLYYFVLCDTLLDSCYLLFCGSLVTILNFAFEIGMILKTLPQLWSKSLFKELLYRYSFWSMQGAQDTFTYIFYSSKSQMLS